MIKDPDRAPSSPSPPPTAPQGDPTPSRAGPSPIPAGPFAQWLKDTREALRSDVGADVPCGSCDVCCRSGYFIHVRPEDRAARGRIPKALLFPAPGLPKGHHVMGFNDKGCCPMLGPGGCTIYADRPQTCRDFDCRIFPAAGIASAGDGQGLVSERAARWRFDYPEAEDRRTQAALKAAVAYLQAEGARFPPGFVPSQPTQLALLAVRVHGVFLPYLQGDALPTAEDLAALVAALPRQEVADAILALARRLGGAGGPVPPT